MKNLYLISQKVNINYDTYDSAVVCAESKTKAKMMHPSGNLGWDGTTSSWDSWCDSEDVKVELIGKANKNLTIGVVCSSFNAG